MPRSNKEPTNGILSTSDLAQLMSVSEGTVRRWIDEKRIVGSYKLTASKERRCPAPCLLEFLKANGMPIPDILHTYIVQHNEYIKTKLQTKNAS